MARARVAVVAAVSRDTVDDLEETAGAGTAMEAAWVLGDPMTEEVADEERRVNRMKELEAVSEFEAFEAVPEHLTSGKRFLTMRWVDTEEKSRIVTRE